MEAHERGHVSCVKAHGLVGSLRFFWDGETHLIDSHAGVHQGDPLGSVLFALAIHDRLISVAEAYDIHIFAYADNMTLFGPLGEVTQATSLLRTDLALDGLSLNEAESEFYFPAGDGPATEGIVVGLVTVDAVSRLDSVSCSSSFLSSNLSSLSSPGSTELHHSPMGYISITGYQELSDETFIITTTLQWGLPQHLVQFSHRAHDATRQIGVHHHDRSGLAN